MDLRFVVTERRLISLTSAPNQECLSSTLWQKNLSNWRNKTSMIKRSYTYLPATWRGFFSPLRAKGFLWDFLHHQTLEQMEINNKRGPGRSHCKELLKTSWPPKESPYLRPFSPLNEVNYPDSTRDDGKSLWDNFGVVDKTMNKQSNQFRGWHPDLYFWIIIHAFSTIPVIEVTWAIRARRERTQPSSIWIDQTKSLLNSKKYWEVNNLSFFLPLITQLLCTPSNSSS